jgi:asparagine synthase (glutamine-hydrolysing)
VCGIAGFLRTDGGPADALAADLDAMTDRLAHRGPDARGAWFDGPLALGHRRLSIIDVSDAGLQPMASRCGRYVIAYNGEVYNFPELRAAFLEPAGIEPRSGTDTEVLLEVLAALGPERALEHVNGMFAFALWDRRDRRLHLVRDRLGIKPLYWARRGPYILFASQLRGLAVHPAWTNALSDAGIWDFLHYTNIGEERTAFADCWKVEPGQHLTIDGSGRVQKRRFFDLAALAARRGSWIGSYEDAVDRLDGILRQVVHDQSRADVPLGAFLSGGVDSSTVVALLRQDRPVHTFSIGYDEPDYDESADARAVAGHLGTDHTEFVLKPGDAAAVIPELATIYDEPFADPSQIPTTIISKLARGAVTVALSGDGGDELFAGYERYERSLAMWRYAERVPRPLRRPAAWGIGRLPPEQWKTLLRPVLADAGQSMPFFADLLRDPSVSAYQERVNSLGVGADACAMKPCHAAAVERLFREPPEMSSALDTLLYVDQRRRLPDTMLTKVDRASMACSLEIRVPLLDNRVLDFAWSVPRAFLIRAGRRKAVLRDVLARYVPPALFERPKKGFHVPLKHWLGGPLREWAESLLKDRLDAVPAFLDATAVRALWRRYLAGDHGLTHPVWVILMFLAWHRTLGSAGRAG